MRLLSESGRFCWGRNDLARLSLQSKSRLLSTGPIPGTFWSFKRCTSLAVSIPNDSNARIRSPEMPLSLAFRINALSRYSSS